MAQKARFFHVEFQPLGSDTVQEMVIREADPYDMFKGIRSFIRNKLFSNFDIRTAEGNFKETVKQEISNIIAESSEYTADDYVRSVKNALDSWKESIPEEYRQLPLDEFYAAAWQDFDRKDHLVFGPEPVQFIEKIFNEIKDVNKLTVREISSAQASVIDDRINCSDDLDKMVDKAVYEETLRENIQKIADLQLDGKSHWMFKNEPGFRENFTDWVLDRLKYNRKDGLDSVTDKAISDAIYMEGSLLDSYLSALIEPSDPAMISEAFKWFQNNKFKYAENYPWDIQPSSDPNFPFDWILWNNQIPVVMYDSQNRCICPCLEIDERSYKIICDVITDAAKKRAGQPILSAADNERYKNVRS